MVLCRESRCCLRFGVAWRRKIDTAGCSTLIIRELKLEANNIKTHLLCFSIAGVFLYTLSLVSLCSTSYFFELFFTVNRRPRIHNNVRRLSRPQCSRLHGLLNSPTSHSTSSLIKQYRRQDYQNHKTKLTHAR